jgi:hypothetical protein
MNDNFKPALVFASVASLSATLVICSGDAPAIESKSQETALNASYGDSEIPVETATTTVTQSTSTSLWDSSVLKGLACLGISGFVVTAGYLIRQKNLAELAKLLATANDTNLPENVRRNAFFKYVARTGTQDYSELNFAGITDFCGIDFYDKTISVATAKILIQTTKSLRGVSFKENDLEDLDLRDVDIREVVLRGKNLSKCKFDINQLSAAATFDATTIFPESLNAISVIGFIGDEPCLGSINNGRFNPWQLNPW